jgi:superfamily II DNA/RNA helicase
MAHNTDMSSSIGSASGNTIDPEEFLFGGTEERLSFAQMEVHPGLVTALAGIEKETATNIQRKSFAPIVAGKDTVIGAETGSGKTLSYMIPILHKLIATSDGESADAMTSTDSSAVNESGEEDKGDLLVKYGGDNVENYPRAIILVPNKELAMQVEDMVRPLLLTLEEAGIKDARGHSIEVQAMTATEDSWPYRGRGNVCPQIMICTPLFIGKDGFWNTFSL